MKRWLTAGRAPAVVLGILALVVAGSGAAYAMSRSVGVITVCVRHQGGSLYRARVCATHDTKLSWNKQGPAGPRGATGAQGTPGTPALYRRTVLRYGSGATDSSPGSTFKQLESIGTFTKLNAGSTITLTWTSHATGGTGSFCQYALRVDGADDTGNTSTAYDSGANSGAVLYSAESAFSVTDVFPLLAAGSHTVSIWDRGTASSCADNVGNFESTVLVLETP